MKKLLAILIVVFAVFFYKSEISDGINKIKDELFEEQIETQTLASEEIKNISIDNFKTLRIGDSIDSVKSKIGNPSRIDDSEYSFEWYVYNQIAEKFAMVGIEDNKVVALYSNSLDSSELGDIKINNYRTSVIEVYEPLEYKKKGNTRYIIDSDNQYDVINIDNKYITVFYDKYDDYKICSYQVISEKAEDSLNGIYAKESESLRESFELQVIDLTNSVRAQRNLNILKFNEQAKTSSRKHSKDMNDRDFFDHVNKDDESPFVRMKKEGIEYIGAGENIAAGQTSAIYAHEAWMNSEGHRKNILGDYKYIGVGVDFGGSYSIYYTQNFFM